MSEETKKEKAVQEAVEEEKKDCVSKKEDSQTQEKTEESEVEKLQKQIETLEKEKEELTSKVDGLKNAYAKAYADTENMKKRLTNDFEMRNKYRAQDFAKEILPVLDNCERALAVSTNENTDEKYKKAFEMVHKQLLKALEKEGVTEIDCLNKPFDPNFHQAMMEEEAEGVEPGMVTAVLQKGYILKDRLLRAAMVKVSK